MAISVDKGEFQLVCDGINTGKSGLEQVKSSLREVTSDSMAMDAFLERVKEIESLKKEYDELVQQDYDALLSLHESLAGLDTTLAQAVAAPR